MIYIDENIWDFDLQEALATVSPERREYALRYRQELDQRLSVAAYRLLQRALRQQYGIEVQPRFVVDDSGKPMLEGFPGIHFSLSHCNKAVACAVGDSPIGIDVETFDHYDEELARRVMSDDEMRHILSSANQAVEFTRLWTMKESFYKMKGGEQDSDVRHLLDQSAGFRFNTVVLNDFVLTCCTL